MTLNPIPESEVRRLAEEAKRLADEYAKEYHALKADSHFAGAGILYQMESEGEVLIAKRARDEAIDRLAARALLAEAVLPPQGQIQAVAPSFDWSAVPPGYRLIAVNHGFEPLMEALDYAARKGYMPDRMAGEWEGFNYDASPWKFKPPEATEPPQGRDSPLPNAPQGQATPSTRSEDAEAKK